MEKKIKKFLKTYKYALILGIALACITALCLFLFVPRNNTPPRVKSESDLTSNLILQALEGEGAISCRIDSDTIKGDAYIKNGKVRVIQDKTSEYENIIFENDIVHAWNSETNTGMIVDIQKNPIASAFISDSEIRRQIEKNTPDCTKGNIDDSLFLVPIDIDFEELDIQDILNGGR